MGRHSARRGAPSRTVLLGAGALVLAVVLALLFVSKPWSGGTPASAEDALADCASVDKANVQVTPTLVNAVRSALDTAAKGGSCVRAEVVGASDDAVASMLSGSTGGPDVWLAASPAWVDLANVEREADLAPGVSIGTSPVGFVFDRALTSDTQVPVGAAALSKILTATAITPTVASAQGSSSVGVAAAAIGAAAGSESTAWDALVGKGADLSQQSLVDKLKAGDLGKTAFLASEQEIVAAGAAAKAAATLPSEGVAQLDYRIVPVTEVGGKVAAKVQSALTSTAGTTALTEAGLRVGDKTPGITGFTAAGSLKVIDATAAQIQGVLGAGGVGTIKANVTFVADVSTDTVKKSAQGGGLAAEQAAMKAIVASLGKGSSVNIFHFPTTTASIGPVVTAVSLGDDAGVTKVNAAIAGLKTTGDTRPLREAYASAVRRANESYVKDVTNVVVLLTGGGQNKPGGGLDEGGMNNAVIAASAVDRPIKFAVIAVGPQADISTVKRLAEITGAQLYRANTVAEATAVGRQAISQATVD